VGGLHVGHLGLVPVWSGTQADDLFNFWEGHACRPVSDLDVIAMENVPGVEELTPLTPYRFRLAIARHPRFKPDHVKKQIEGIFECYP
jgi:hypothetical protein